MYFSTFYNINEDIDNIKENQNFKNWFGDSKVVDSSDNPTVVYHGTGSKFKKFNLKKATQGILWFTSNKKEIEGGTIGAQGSGVILSLYVRIENPAGWKEYDQLMLDELRNRGYDGVVLPNKDGSFDGFVFDPNQFKSAIGNDGEYSKTDNNIYK